MQRTPEDLRRLIKIASQTNGEGLYWGPVLTILIAARPEILDATGRPAEELHYLNLGYPGIHFADMLNELHWSGPVREMIKVAWALFNSGEFFGPESMDAVEIAPSFNDIACRLDERNLSAVLDAMRMRKGLYAVDAYSGPRGEDMARHNTIVTGLHQRLMDRLGAALLEWENMAPCIS